MRHLVIGQRQKAPNFSAFHWSPHGCLITIGQHFVTTRVVHLPKRTETSLITESDQSRANHQLLQICTVRTAWSNLDQAVRAVHSCKSCFFFLFHNKPQSGSNEGSKHINLMRNSQTYPCFSFLCGARLLSVRIPSDFVTFILCILCNRKELKIQKHNTIFIF